MYPITWAIVEVELYDSCHWFLERLLEDVEVVNQHRFTFITNM